MQNTEAPCEESERVIKKLKTNRSSLPTLLSYDSVSAAKTSQNQFCLFSKLLALHHEECAKNPDENRSGLKYNSFLLEKLVKRERLNTLILNLYPGNKGFSIAFRTIPRTEPGCEDTANMIETVQWPYEDEDILRHIDNEELPPTLVDIFEMHYSYMFYSGCIIAEIRDYRQAYPHLKSDIHHVLLRPTLKSIITDIDNIIETNTDEKQDGEWSSEEKHMLESQILLANNPQMCLDPDNSVSFTKLRLNQSRNMWNTHEFHRKARKFSQVTVNRKRKLDVFTHRGGLELFDYINRVRMKSDSINTGLKIPKVDVKSVPAPNLDPPLIISPPTQGVVINEFKAYQPPAESHDYLPQLVEEYVLDTMTSSKDKNKSRIYHIKLSILQRPSNLEYLGELYLDRDHKENEQNGVACRFALGSRTYVNKYVKQFTETFTKSGRQSVRMRHGKNPNYRNSVCQLQVATQSASNSSSNQQQQQQQVQQSSGIPNHVVNGLVQNQTFTSSLNNPILKSHLQATSSANKSTNQALTNEQMEINALVIDFMNFSDQIEASAQAKQQQERQQQLQLQQKSANASNAIINIRNNSPAGNTNGSSAVVVNAMNNSSLLSQQIQANNIQKLLTSRKMTLMNLPTNARVLSSNTGNLVVNNNRFTDQLGQQTITFSSVNNTTAVKQQQQPINQRNNEANKQTVLSAMLVGTPAADRPDIVSTNTNSLLLEKLASSSSSKASFLQNSNKPQPQKFVVQSQKIQAVKSPMSSPTQTSQNAPPNAINMQNLKFSQLQNVQVQFPGFSQPFSLSLNVSPAGNIQGHPTGLLVSVPVTSSVSSSSSVSQAANTVNTGSTVVLANASGSTSLAQLVSGMKTINQQGMRQGVPTNVSLAQGQPFQLITSLQNPRLQQANLQQARTIQRTPITVKMATTSPNANSSNVQPMQKQSQIQQFQQFCLSQQQNIGKLRSNTSTDPQ